MLSQQAKSMLASYQVKNHEALLNYFTGKTVQQGLVDLFNHEIQSSLKASMISLMEVGSYSQICSLLELMFSSLSNQQIKKEVVINLLENVLECISITDLKEILKVIKEHILKFKNLSPLNLNKMLRIINHLLKRVSKTEDYHIRGQLHVSLTKIMTVCHDSGFHYRFQNATTGPILKEKDEVFGEEFKENESMNEKFFQEFWGLQRFFMNLNELAYSQNEKEDVDNQLVGLNLKNIVEILSGAICYFDKNKATDENNLMTFPVKFMKLSSLFTLQLSDRSFRKVFLLQCLIFCFGLKKSHQKLVFQFKPEHKQIVESIQNKIIKKLQEESRKQEVKVYENFVEYLKNEQIWIELKDNWKDKKKTYFKESVYEIKELKRKTYNPEQIPEARPVEKPQLHAQIDLKKIRQKSRREIDEKLKINGSNMMKFLRRRQDPKLKEEGVTTSFSYYFSQGQSCLQTYDNENEEQTQFETRGQYNLFEWKSLRSLFRQNLQDVFYNNKFQSFKEYRLLNIINKKQEEFVGESKKRVKLDLNAEES